MLFLSLSISVSIQLCAICSLRCNVFFFKFTLSSRQLLLCPRSLSVHSSEVIDSTEWSSNLKIIIFPNRLYSRSICGWQQLTISMTVAQTLARASLRIVRTYLSQWNCVGMIGKYHLILLSSLFADSELWEQQEEISSILWGENGVQIRICTWINRIEEHQKDLRSCHINEWVAWENKDREKSRQRV